MFTLALLDIDIASVYSKYIQPTIILMWLSSQNSTSHFVYTCVAFFHSTILSTMATLRVMDQSKIWPLTRHHVFGTRITL
jgi:hypothetical protein